MHKSSEFPPPPPPRRRRTAGGATDLKSSQNEEEKSKMAAGNEGVFANRSSITTRTRTYYFRKCKRIMRLLTNMESLPDEMVSAILVKLPAQFIYDIARLVCWKWYRMIHTREFIHEHLQRSSTIGSTGLILQDLSKHLMFLSMRQEDRTIEISNFTYEFTGEVSSSCNGLVLVADRLDRCAIYVVNPATKQHTVLPRFFRYTSYAGCPGLAYVASSMEYKVVISYHKFLSEDSVKLRETSCAILTVGVDNSWRHLSTDHLSANARRLLFSTPLVTQSGFIHWITSWDDVNSENRVVTLNVETETFRETCVPQGGYEMRGTWYLSIGSYLSFVVSSSSKWTKLSWEVWEMKSETGEWTKLPNIDLEAENWKNEELLGDPHPHFGYYLEPIGWLIYKEVMVFYVTFRFNLLIVYDVRTHKIQHFSSFKLRLKKFLSHVNSLVWLDA